MTKILVIDDNAMVRKTISTILRHGGFEVELATNGREGIEVFRKGAPDLVITDLIMPEKEGIETILELRQVHPDIKIIAISGGSPAGNVDFLRMAQTLGANAIIAKPFRANELISCVKDCLAAA